MGYTTDFKGQLKITPALKPEHAAYINAFSGTRRVKRDAQRTSAMPDPLRQAVGLPVGPDGAYFVGASDPNVGPNQGPATFTAHGQAHTPDVRDYNNPPAGQPGLWCQWVVEGDALEWDGGEKFYEYAPWLEYLIEHFFRPWGYSLTGSIEWAGEDRQDRGEIVVVDNKVSTRANEPVTVSMVEQARHYLKTGELPDNDADLMRAAMESLLAMADDG